MEHLKIWHLVQKNLSGGVYLQSSEPSDCSAEPRQCYPKLQMKEIFPLFSPRSRWKHAPGSTAQIRLV